MNWKEKIKEHKASVIDVRTPEEYSAACCPESVNIPLHEVPDRVDELREMQRPLVLCCRSGARSGRATDYLKSQGIDEVYNGGGWTDVKQIQKD